MLKYEKTEKDKRIRRHEMQHLRWSSSVFPGVLCGKTGDRVEMGEQVKVVLNLRSAPLNTRAFFAKTNLKPSSTAENPAMNSFSNNRSNNSGWRKYVNTSTDKHCILGIRTVLRLAWIWTHWQLFLCWTPNVSTVCTVVWISGCALMSCWEPQRKQLFYQWDYYTRQVEILRTQRSFWLCLSLLLSLSSAPSFPIFLFRSLPEKNRVERC